MILLDANPLIALVDDRQQLSLRARADLRGLISQRLLLPTMVLVEVCHALPYRPQRLRLERIIEELDIQPCPIRDEARFWLDVFDWMQRYAEHLPDWVDGSLAVLCGQNKRYKVWSYDREFHTIWRRPDGSRIPLAVSPL